MKALIGLCTDSGGERNEQKIILKGPQQGTLEVPQLCLGGIQKIGVCHVHTDVILASGARDDDDDDGHEVPPFYIYKLPIDRLSGCYW